jgi:hypothetical protein
MDPDDADDPLDSYTVFTPRTGRVFTPASSIYVDTAASGPNAAALFGASPVAAVGTGAGGTGGAATYSGGGAPPFVPCHLHQRAMLLLIRAHGLLAESYLRFAVPRLIPVRRPRYNFAPPNNQTLVVVIDGARREVPLRADVTSAAKAAEAIGFWIAGCAAALYRCAGVPSQIWPNMHGS